MRVLPMSTGGGYDSSNSYYSRSWTSRVRDEKLSLEFSRSVFDLAYYCSSSFSVHGETEKAVDRFSVK